jgi:putative proteasome-type protease
MTFCLGMKVAQGLVGIADTRITSGREVTTANKVAFYQARNQSLFLMTSGLRSLRDKTLTYFDEVLSNKTRPFDRVYKAVNALADQVRRVAKEDRDALKASELPFDIYCLVGGQMKNDKEHMLYLLYPEGNWIEITSATPYYIIGSSMYGKPVLDRTLAFDDPLNIALKVGCLAFDSTRISAADVDFPVDVVIYEKNSYRMAEHRFEARELEEITSWWQENLRKAVQDLPAKALDDVVRNMTAKRSAKTKRVAKKSATARRSPRKT